MTPSDHRRRARELREPRRRDRQRAGRADRLRGPARRAADDPREAAGRLRPGRVEQPLRPRGRDRARAPTCARSSAACSRSSTEAGMADEPQGHEVEQLRLRERLAKLRNLPLIGGVGVSGRAREARAPDRADRGRAEHRRGLALGRARPPRGAAVHARLRGADLRRLHRAARRPLRGGRRGDRRRTRPLPRPVDRARRPPEGPRPARARAPQLRDALPGGLPQGDAHHGSRRPARLPGAHARGHAGRVPRAGRRAARPGRLDRPLASSR